MSKYTTEVRFICETESGLKDSVGYNDIDSVIQKALPKIFDFDFPIFDEDYRNILETKIIKHYYTREIGAETYGLWKFWLNTRLNEIMPLYNKMYLANNLDYDILGDTDLKTTHEGKADGEGTATGVQDSKLGGADTNKHTGDDTRTRIEDNVSTSQGESKRHDVTDFTGNFKGNAWDMYSDTPQGTITDLGLNKYLTNARHNTQDDDTINQTVLDSKASNKNTANDKINAVEKTEYNSQNVNEYGRTENTTHDNKTTFSNTDEYVEHIIGKRGGQTFTAMVREYRESLVNVDMLIIDELSDLFLNLW